MTCRVTVADPPTVVRLAVRGLVDETDVAAIEAAVDVSLADGRRVVVDVADVTTPSVPLLRSLARIAALPHARGRVEVAGADVTTRQFLRLRGLDGVLAAEPPG